jgi:hypothetical protein
MAKTMQTQNKREGSAALIEAELDAFLQHELMEEARAYVERRRKMQTLSSAEVVDTWVARFKRWFSTEGNPRNMDDAAAEIRLRGLEMPYERVENEIRAFRAELARLDPENLSSPHIDRKINDYLVARSKPKN